MQAVPSQTFQSIDTQPAQYILQLNAPASKQVSQSAGTDVGIDPLGQEKVGGADTPGSLSGMALLTDSTAESDESCCTNIYGVSSKCNRFSYIATISNAT